MKRVIIAVLILSFTFQIAAQFGTLLYFTANQNYIAKNLCVNISKPKMHCEGQCVLTKLLKKTEQDQQNKKAFNNRVLEAFVHGDSDFVFSNLAFDLKNKKAIFKSAFIINPPTSIFHPPPIV